jgi:hypothetical protein
MTKILPNALNKDSDRDGVTETVSRPPAKPKSRPAKKPVVSIPRIRVLE